MATSSIDSVGLTNSSSTDLSTAAQSNMGKEDFLKLLVAQLANQDPLQPMENTQFVAQLAQFSSLEQLMSVNSNLSLIQVGQAGMTNGQVASLIGRNIEAKGDTLQLTNQGAANVTFDLGSSAKEVTIKITDSEGNIVRTLQLGNRAPGVNSYQWDGKDENGNFVSTGNYSVAISAKDDTGGAVDASTHVSGIVSGISYDGGVPLLEIGNAKVRVGDVISIRQPESGSK